MQAVESIIRLEGIEKRYILGGEVEVRALRGVDLVVNRGSYLAIMGPSGSGKSTMLNLVGCLDRPTAGSYFLGGTDVSRMPDDELSQARGRTIGFIFQSYNLIAQLTVLENIQVPLLYQGKDIRGYHDHCIKLAELVGLAGGLDVGAAMSVQSEATLGELANFMALHATMHAGQITIIRRSLGRPPIV